MGKLEMADPQAAADIEEENSRTRELVRLRGIKFRAKRDADPQRRVVSRELERMRGKKRRTEVQADPIRRELGRLKKKKRMADQTPAQRERRLRKDRENQKRLRRARAVEKKRKKSSTKNKRKKSSDSTKTNKDDESSVVADPGIPPGHGITAPARNIPPA